MQERLPPYTTTHAKVKQDADQAVIHLLAADAAATSATVAHLTLLSGHEQGVRVSLDGAGLTIDLAAYEGLAQDAVETLLYQYRVYLPSGDYHRQTATVTLVGTDKTPYIRDALLATYQQDDHTVLSGILGEQQSETTTLAPLQNPVATNSSDASVPLADAQPTMGRPKNRMASPDSDNRQLPNTPIAETPQTQLPGISIDRLLDGENSAEQQAEAINSDAADALTQENSDERCLILSPDAVYVFCANDFDTTINAQGNPGRGVRLATLPTQGTLLFNRQPVRIGQAISRNALLAGRLTFHPASNTVLCGNNEAYFKYAVDQQQAGVSHLHGFKIVLDQPSAPLS